MTTAVTSGPARGRAAYRDIALYAPDRSPARIDLSDNTNRHGISPAVASVLRSADEILVTRYPGVYANDLKRALAGYVGVTPDCVVTGCGSDDVLDSAMRAFAEPGESIAFSQPTFPMIPIFARMNGLQPVSVPYRADLTLDVDALLATNAKLIYVCSPNNPTGGTASVAALGRLIDGARGIVIVDEAYIEYGGETLARLAVDDERILVTRTMSKAFGLAGLRVGYAVGAPAVISEVEKSRGPYKVGALSERAAITSLTDGLEWVQYHVAKDLQSREWLFNQLASLGLSPVPSQANFVLARVSDATSIASAMRLLGVAVRPFSQLAIIGDALRISVGPSEMMAECLEALRKTGARAT